MALIVYYTRNWLSYPDDLTYFDRTYKYEKSALEEFEDLYRERDKSGCHRYIYQAIET